MYANYVVSGERRLGWWDGETMLRLSGPPTDRLLVTGWPAVPDDAPVEREPFRFLPAVLAPGKILCLLRSYRGHAEELGNEPPPDPTFFAKLRNALTGHREPIRIPADLEGEVHHEGELAVVIGRGGRRIGAGAAMEHVAALTVANDVTARTLQKADQARGWPWVRSKSLDTFLPLGPGLLPAGDAPDPMDVDLTVRVNGELRQDGSTALLLWSVEEIVSRLSRWVRLEPGDVILTGTPEGVGPISPGDEVVVSIGRVGALANPVVREPGGEGR